jgi:hypothetical protein
MVKDCTKCWFKAAGIGCRENPDICLGLDITESADGTPHLRICAGVNSAVENASEELLEAIDLMIDRAFGEEPSLSRELLH